MRCSATTYRWQGDCSTGGFDEASTCGAGRPPPLPPMEPAGGQAPPAGVGRGRHPRRHLRRSEVTIYWRARKLGLPCGAPQGSEHLTAAAKRCGFCTSQLRTILREALVRIYRTLSRPRSSGENKRRTKRTFAYVMPDAVDAAVARWCGSEIVTTAAEARGIGGGVLRRWLLEAGHKPPKASGRVKFRKWRVPTPVIDAVIAARRDLASVRAHAQRLHVTPPVLAQRLRRAGVLGPKRPGVQVKLATAVVDAVVASDPIRRIRPSSDDVGRQSTSSARPHRARATV